MDLDVSQKLFLQTKSTERNKYAMFFKTDLVPVEVNFWLVFLLCFIEKSLCKNILTGVNEFCVISDKTLKMYCVPVQISKTLKTKLIGGG